MNVRAQHRILGACIVGFALMLALLPAVGQRLRAAPATATVNVAHFAPFGADVDATSVTVRVTSSEGIAELANVKFGDIAAGVPLPSETALFIEIIPTGTATAAISATVTLDPDVAYTVAAIGDGTNQALELLPLVDETEPATDTAKLRIGHFSPFGTDDASTAVDICSDSGVAIVENFSYKDVVGYAAFAPGDYDLKIALAGSNCETVALDLPSIRLNAGEIYDVFAIGLPGNAALPLQTASTTGVDLSPATVNIAHLAPFAPTAAETTVTIRVNGEDALTGLAYGDPAVAAELPAGEALLIEVVPDITGQVALSASVTLDPAGEYTALAIGDNANQPLDILALSDATAPPADGFGKIRIGHLAPFAADLEATRVDVCQEDIFPMPVPGLTDIPYGLITPDFVEFPAGDYDLLIAVAGSNCADVALDLPPVRISSGDIKDVYAIGKNTEAYPLAFYTVLGLNLAPSLINIAHYAPFSDTVETTAVAIQANGNELARGVKYGDKIIGFEAQPGVYTVGIAVPDVAAAGADAIYDTVVISKEITIESKTNYTIIATGDNRNQPLDILVLEDMQPLSPPTPDAYVRLGHLAPFAADLEATRVDICTEANEPVLTGVVYGVVTDPYLTLPAGIYDLKVAIAGTGCATTAIDVPAFQVAAGDIVDAYAIGTGAGAFPLAIDSITGLGEPPTAIDDDEPDFIPGEDSRIFLPVIVR
jgi:hypothetical protein